MQSLAGIGGKEGRYLIANKSNLNEPNFKISHGRRYRTPGIRHVQTARYQWETMAKPLAGGLAHLTLCVLLGGRAGSKKCF